MQFTLVDWALEGLGIEATWLPRTIGVVSIWAAGVTAFISVVALFSVWLERKVSARIQCRLGPMEVGPHGSLQTLADGLKLLTKEDLVPAGADRFLFMLAPVLAFAGTFVAFAVIPFGPDLIISDLNLGLFFVAAVGSLEAIGVICAGWASNNKWALFGSIRAATQVVSYEIPLGLSLVTVAVLAGSLQVGEIVQGQSGWIWNWYLFRNPLMPISFVIFFIASLAECKRAPFDLAEAESELVSGFHTEYSGMRFGIFFLAEYGAMYIVSAVAAVMYLGGWFTGIAPLDAWIAESSIWANLVGLVVVLSKSFFLIFVQMWLRWTLPRIRLDQMMYLCLKVLLPVGMVVLMASSLWQAFAGAPSPDDAWGSVSGLVIFFALLGCSIVMIRKTIRASTSFKLANYKT